LPSAGTTIIRMKLVYTIVHIGRFAVLFLYRVINLIFLASDRRDPCFDLQSSASRTGEGKIENWRTGVACLYTSDPALRSQDGAGASISVLQRLRS